MTAITGQRWYKPMEIARLGLIKSSKGEEATVWSNYYFILRLIKTGQLKAKNYSKGKRAYFLVPEQEITRYHKTVNGID